MYVQAVAAEVAKAAMSATGGDEGTDGDGRAGVGRFEVAVFLRLSLSPVHASLRLSRHHLLQFESDVIHGDVQAWDGWWGRGRGVVSGRGGGWFRGEEEGGRGGCEDWESRKASHGTL